MLDSHFHFDPPPQNVTIRGLSTILEGWVMLAKMSEPIQFESKLFGLNQIIAMVILYITSKWSWSHLRLVEHKQNGSLAGIPAGFSPVLEPCITLTKC